MYGLSSCIQASQHGNTDATERLAALSQPAPAALSRQEHDSLTETTLVRKRTQARQRSDARGGPRQGGRPNGQQVVANIRKNSLAYRPEPARGYAAMPAAPADDYYAMPRLPIAPVPPLGGPGPNATGGSRPPIQPGPGPGPQPPQGNNNPGSGGYPSPRMPPQQPPYAQLARPPSQSTLGGGGAGGMGQPGQPGRRPMRVGSGGSPPSRPATVRTPSPTALSDPPVARPPPGKGPATFQEMGFQSSKLQEKDCVIM